MAELLFFCTAGVRIFYSANACSLPASIRSPLLFSILFFQRLLQSAELFYLPRKKKGVVMVVSGHFMELSLSGSSMKFINLSLCFSV